jgi:hypothetical protein
MNRCIWVVGAPRTGTNAAALFLRRCGLQTWLVRPTWAPNAWNHEWAEDPLLWNYTVEALGLHSIQQGFPALQRVDASQPIRTPSADRRFRFWRYCTSRNQASRGRDFVLKNNWLAYTQDCVFDALPTHEHVLVHCTRPLADSVASFAAQRIASPHDCGDYITQIVEATATLACDFQTAGRSVYNVPFPEVAYQPKAVLAELVRGLNLAPPDSAYAKYDPKHVRYDHASRHVPPDAELSDGAT